MKYPLCDRIRFIEVNTPILSKGIGFLFLGGYTLFTLRSLGVGGFTRRSLSYLAQVGLPARAGSRSRAP